MIEIRFMSLTGKFETVRKATFQSSKEAFDAVKQYAESNGFRNVKTVSEEWPDVRYTATTPGGRGGRNIAFACDIGNESMTDD